MIRFIMGMMSWVLSQALLAVICWPLYDRFLFEIVKIELGFFQWFSIIIISSCIIPVGKAIKPNTTNTINNQKSISKKARFKQFLNTIIHDRQGT